MEFLLQIHLSVIVFFLWIISVSLAMQFGYDFSFKMANCVMLAFSAGNLIDAITTIIQLYYT